MNQLFSLPYTLRDIPFFNKAAIIPINFVAFTLLLMVLNHNKSSAKKTKVFVLMTVFMLLWVDFAYLARLFGLYPDISELFLRVAWFATPLLFFFTYLTFVYVIEQEDFRKKISIALFVLASILSTLTAFSDLVISGVKFTNNTLDIVYGQGLYPFLFCILIFIGFTLYPMIRGGVKTKEAGYFLTGVIIFYLANFIFNITLPIFFNITHVYYFGDYSTVFLLGFTSYAILRHELFDIKTFATEIFAMIIISIAFSKLFFAQSISETITDFFIFISMAIFGVFLVRSVGREIEQRERLQILTLKLKELDSRKNEFVSIAAHELRAPMTAIKGYISMLLEGDAGDLTPQTVEFLKETVDANERMIRLVNNMLNITRIEENRQVYQMGVCNLVSAVEVVFNEFRAEAAKKGLNFNLQMEAGNIPSDVYVDQDRIHEVITNFISNGVKYTDRGYVNVIISSPRVGVVRFEVADTGIGIAAKDQSRVFQKFYRVESSVGRAIGTGLGLYISKLLIEKFGGTIGFFSEAGKGSRFWFELPVVMGKTQKPNILV